MPLHQFIWCLSIRASRLLRHAGGQIEQGPTFVNPALPLLRSLLQTITVCHVLGRRL